MKELNALVEAAKEAVKDLRTEISSTVTVGDVVANRLKIAIATAEAAAKPVKPRVNATDGTVECPVCTAIIGDCDRHGKITSCDNFCPIDGTPIDHE